MVICENGSRHTFRVYLPEAAQVELVGAFTDWRGRPIRMTREHTGWWAASVNLPPGDHDFCYLVNGSTWLADYAASGVKRNGFGGWVSQISVASPVTIRTIALPGDAPGVGQPRSALRRAA